MAEHAVSGPERWSRAPRVGQIDALAHEGFGRGAEAYARGRPGYPAPAEQLPVADDTADAVVCGEAFHWFDGERTLEELARVLRPGGGVGLIWNLHRWDPE